MLRRNRQGPNNLTWAPGTKIQFGVPYNMLFATIWTHFKKKYLWEVVCGGGGGSFSIGGACENCPVCSCPNQAMKIKSDRKKFSFSRFPISCNTFFYSNGIAFFLPDIWIFVCLFAGFDYIQVPFAQVLACFTGVINDPFLMLNADLRKFIYIKKKNWKWIYYSFSR